MLAISLVSRARSMTLACPTLQPIRHISFLKRLLVLNDNTDSDSSEKIYPWDESPYEDLRTRAAYIRSTALCPVTEKPVDYVCPISGIPTHHDHQAWANDTEYHSKEKYELLKKVNLYEHDLRSGRVFDEFVFPGAQEHDFMTSLSNWDSFFYTRDFNPMNTEFNMAAATKVLTYPITIASVLHRLTPYFLQPKGPLSLEGLKSVAALKYSLYPPYQKHEGANVYKERPIRIFIVGAKMEAMLPGYVWKQFGYLFPESKFEFHFIGPECYFDRATKSFSATNEPNGRALVERYDEQITLHYHTMYFHELYNFGDLFPFDPYLDVFFMFHPGFQTPDKPHWDKSLKGLLESKCAVYVTGYHQTDTLRERAWLLNHPLAEEMDILMDQTQNVFGSTKIDLVDSNPTETFQANDEIFAFRGKRYHAIKK
ncbi:translational activator for mitochondrial COX1 [Yamadazyma tenuis]|uniref:Uncharacterized protein n=1 Tax=Candida tenuis (strain ATCC 10573 / BCRC 21748 / CBS 615 / JCM 9827 / NBRC 10315 / NRRL Y-1498 / VKM Y-70) TaxID=590646 RepID=G3AWU9_CANTC|nr:uncharacterized protein CANTEDRAFT_112336 [Yamadazyma tenuis ATCC 10573]XP_006684103.1 uncharacterized protein CANTEDRAFT_112336 [Yamadazyma tenuis ATCC 10573]EGV66844.1 hypothetical protein CANTEDRAFT_112336 [Yamadazyma tenuis ATCC 10573]EGV66845.1 hypothetical protein CANTEDRAFT_112336 [Yamadazyma tenuis ATCC 10573]WEJ95254.1 translational activator for mitochondrial COX1 [Yamadazyma tenuis]